jgi:hypothetical protein
MCMHRFIETPREGEKRRQGLPVSAGVLLPVSDEGAFITGSTLSINGGQH